MSVVCSFEQLDPHEKQNCGYRKGGISAVGVLKADHGIDDFSSAVDLQAAINAGNLRIIKGIKVTIPDPTPIEGENPIACGSETILDGFDGTYTWKDFNVTNNNGEFYRQLNSSEFSGLILYFCQNDEIEVLEKKVSFVALFPDGPESNKEKRKYTVTAKWSKDVNDAFNIIYDAPEGIFV